MPFECPPRDSAASSVLDSQSSNVKTHTPASMITLQYRPAPSSSGVQNMVCSHGLYGFTPMYATGISVAGGQQRQMPKHTTLNHRNAHHQRLSSSPSSSLDNGHMIPATNVVLEAKHPLLLKLLTNNEQKDVSQSKRTSQPAVSTSASSSLDDDQILRQIENKLNEYRNQMKALQEKQHQCHTAKNSLELNRPRSAPKVIATCTPYPSAPEKALHEDSGIDKETSACNKQDSEWSKINDSGTTSPKQCQGTILSNSPHDMRFVDKSFDQFDAPVKTKDFNIEHQWKHICSKDSLKYNYFLNDVTTLQYSLTALKELVNSLDNVQTRAASVDSSFDKIVHQYWDGKIDNVRLFTSTEYGRIMQQAAAICTKTEEEGPVVVKSLSGTTLDELTARNPQLTRDCRPSDVEYKSMWRNVNRNLTTDEVGSLNTFRSKMKVLETSKCRKTKSIPAPSAALKGQPVKAKKTSKEKQKRSTSGNENVTIDSTQDLNMNNSTEGLRQNLHWQEPSEQVQTQEKVVQAGFGKIENRFSSCAMEVPGPKHDNTTTEKVLSRATPQIMSEFEDANNDESLVLGAFENLPKHELHKELHRDAHSTTHFPDFEFEDISDDDGSNTGLVEPLARHELTKEIPQDTSTHSLAHFAKTAPAIHYEDISDESSGPSKQNADDVKTESNENTKKQSDVSKQELTCTCPCFFETEDGFEERLCPKCAKENQELDCDGEEWVVIQVVPTEVTLLQQINDSEEENQEDFTATQDNRPNSPRFKKIEEFETLEELLAQMSKPFPMSFQSSDNLSPKPESPHCSKKADDSSDTDDSIDYPLQTKLNYLTVSGRNTAPSPLPHISDSSEDELPSSPEETNTISKPVSDWFPDSDEEGQSSGNETNQVPAVESIVNASLFYEQTQEKPQTGKKAKFKRIRFIDSDTDYSDEEEQFSGNETNKEPDVESIVNASPVDEQMQQKPQTGKKAKFKRVRFADLDPADGRKNSKNTPFQSKEQAEEMAQNSSFCQKLKTLISDKETNAQAVPKNQAVKRKHSSTAPDKSKAKQPRLLTSRRSSEEQTMSESVVKMAGPKMDTTPQNVSSRSALSNQSRSNQNDGHASRKRPEHKISSVTGTLTVGDTQYKASSLPGCKPSPPEKQNPHISKPNQMGSYDTTHSTDAKKKQMEEWKNAYHPTILEKRNGYEKGCRVRKSRVKSADDVNRESLPRPSAKPAQRKRNNSQDLQPKLMKKSQKEAQQWTFARNRQATSNNKFVAKGYKWSGK